MDRHTCFIGARGQAYWLYLLLGAATEPNETAGIAGHSLHLVDAQLRELANTLGFDLVPRKSSEASRADHEYRVLNGCEPPVTEATGWDARQSSRVDQPAAEGM